MMLYPLGHTYSSKNCTVTVCVICQTVYYLLRLLFFICFLFYQENYGKETLNHLPKVVEPYVMQIHYLPPQNSSPAPTSVNDTTIFLVYEMRNLSNILCGFLSNLSKH